MATASEILNDPAYTNANEATKQAIFDRHIASDASFVDANPATQAAIRQRFGIGAPITSQPAIPKMPTQQEPAVGENPVAPFPTALDQRLAPHDQVGLQTIGPDLLAAAKQIPKQLHSAVTQTFEGNDPESILKQTIANKIIDDARHEVMKNATIPGAEDEYINVMGASIKRSDVRNMPQNLAFSAVAMASALLAGFGAGLTTGNPKAAMATGAAAAGKVAYNMDTNSFLRDFRDGLNQESIQQRGIPITNAEYLDIVKSPEMQIKAKEYSLNLEGHGSVMDLARKHGLHEAGWEAIGNTITLGAGKYIFKNALEGKIIKPAAAFVGETLAELGGETATQIGQHNVEREAGLNKDLERSWIDPESWKQSFKEVAGPTLLTTGVIGGVPYIAGRAVRAITPQQPTQEQPTPQTKETPVPPTGTAPPTGETKPTTETPQPNVVPPEALISHAETRLKELETKANGTPAQETVDETGNKITIPAQPAQAMTPQEVAELKFLQEHQNNPDKLAEGYGVTIGKPTVTGSQDVKGALGELDGKPLPVPPIYQPPAEETKPTQQNTLDLLPIGSEVSWVDSDGNQMESTILDVMSKAGVTMYKVTSTDSSKPNGVWVEASHLQPIENKPVEPEVPPTPEVPPSEEKPPVAETPPIEEKPAEKEPVILNHKNGNKDEIPTLDTAEEEYRKANVDPSKFVKPINRDKDMYALMSWQQFSNFLGKTSQQGKPNDSGFVAGLEPIEVTDDINKALSKNKKRNQVLVKFRQNTLSGKAIGRGKFLADDISKFPIEHFAIHRRTKQLPRFEGSYYNEAADASHNHFIWYHDENGNPSARLNVEKSEATKAKEEKQFAEDYIKHLNRPRGENTHTYSVDKDYTPQFNYWQKEMLNHETVGSALNDLIDRYERGLKEGTFDKNGYINSSTHDEPTMYYLENKKQAEMYLDIMKHVVKIEPVAKAHLYMDPNRISDGNFQVFAFYNSPRNYVAMFTNAKMPTFIHEVVHAATVHFVNTNPNHPLVKKLEKLLEASRKKDKKIRGKYQLYGNTNTKEFLAEGFSNPQFIKHLMDINPIFETTDPTKAGGLWENLKEVIREMIGQITGKPYPNKTAFSELMDISGEMFTGKTLEGYKYNIGQKGKEETTSSKQQIESPAFKKWFGNSKVVNPDGSPRVMYHGTKQNINEFKSDFQLRKEKNQDYGQRLTTAYGLGGIYFTPDPSYANRYAKTDFRKTKEQANVIPVYLRMENPYVYPSGIWADLREKFLNPIDSFLYSRAVRKNIKEKGFPDAENIKSMQISRHGYMFARINEINKLKAKGYDGIISPDGNMFIVFNGSQVKSAIGNKGTYKLDSDVITESRGPLTEEDISLNVEPMNEQQAQDEQQTRQIFNYRGDPVDIREWEIPEQGPIAARLSKWFQYFADEDAVLTRIMKTLRSLNRYISDLSDIEKKQELKNSRISAQLMVFANEEVNPIVKQMLDEGVSLEEINKFMLAKHAPAYNERMNNINHSVDRSGNIIPYRLKDRASSMSTQDALDYLNSLNPERKALLENIAKKWYAIRDKTQKILVESGDQTQETIDLWNETYPFYVPLNREQEQQAMPANLRTGSGTDVRGDFSKRATGSEKQVISIADALLYQRERAISRAENNEVGKSIYRLFIEHPNPKFAISVNPDAIYDREALIAELQQLGYDNAADVVDNIMAEPKEKYLRKVKPSDFVIDPTTGFPIPNTKEVVDARVSRNARFGDNVLTLKINGHERYVFFDKKDPNAVTMIRTLKQLDAQQLGWFLSGNRMITHYMARIYTVLNPIFGIVNGLKDYPFGMANLSTTPIRGKQLQVTAKIMPAMLGIMTILRKERSGGGYSPSIYKWQRIYNEALDAGFQTSNRYAVLNSGEDRTYIANLLDQFKDNNAKQVFRYVINMTYDFASMIENGVRLAAYQQMREAGYSPQESASVAKNLTINFDKKGSRTTYLRSLYMFFNASIQNTVRLGKTLAGPSGGRIIAGGIALGVMQAMMIAAAGFKDDDPPEYIKAHNLIIPTGDGKYITIPMPYGLNILPNTGRILTELAIDIDKHHGFEKAHISKHALDWTNALFSTFSPFGNQGLSMNTLIPTTMVAPFAVSEFGTNTNGFGQTISKQDSYKRPTPGYTRTKESGSDWGKEFARWMNKLTLGTDYTKGGWSPTGDDIDFLASTYLGPVLGSIHKTYAYAKAKLSGEEVPAYKVPVLGRFQGETDSKPVITSRFYTNLNAMYEHEFTLKNLRDNPQATAQYYKDHPDARGWRIAEGFDAKINQINAAKKQQEMNHAPKEVLQRLDNVKIIQMNKFNDAIEKLRNQ